MSKIRPYYVAGILGLLLILFATLQGQSPTSQPAPVKSRGADSSISKADKLFDDKNYAEAAEAYTQITLRMKKQDGWHHASERIITCHLRLQQFDDALTAAEAHIKRCKGTPLEARAERFAGNLYLLIPKWGTRAGGDFHRGKSMQGIRVYSYKHDKKLALEHLQRARDLYAQYDGDIKALEVLGKEDAAGWRLERLACLGDLAGACARYGIFENQPMYWHWYWAERDDTLAETAGEEDFDEYHNQWEYQRKRPIGLRIDKNGDPVFAAPPTEWKDDLGDEQKLLYLLAEIRELDNTNDKRFVSESWYRQAMLARTRFGLDRLNTYSGYYYVNGRQPLKEEIEAQNPWELADDESLVLAGGRVKRVKLPPQWDVIALLRKIDDFTIATQARYALGLYYQSRQQYVSALATYDELLKNFPPDQWTKNAQSQRSRILQAEVQINRTGVQLTGEPAQTQISHRNVEQVWFVARRVDHVGLLNELRGKPTDPNKGHRYFWQLQNWHHHFVHGYHKQNELQVLASKYIGQVVAEWTHRVERGPNHRSAQVTLPTPLRDGGAYLIHAYTSKPKQGHDDRSAVEVMQDGNSRAMVVLSDLAIVEKKTSTGNLYFITHAQTGAPVADATINVLEVWNEWDSKRRRQIYHRHDYTLTTDQEGMAELKRPQRRYGNVHTLVTAGPNRTAWTGMSYWSHYHPSRHRNGQFAYCITDRPVYRPEQAVRFKAWLRQMNNGQYSVRQGQNVSIVIYDPRGNKVHNSSHQLDEFGGLDGQFTLGEEPPLGVYQIQITGTSYAGGQSFRVEEYKKPEFEVSVQPGKSHAKLGEKVTAAITAKYYFGSPVTEGTVKYKVFRETYRHSYYFPGRWDWLYGPGYGWAWYDAPWFDWWHYRTRCWIAPHWWWGYYGRPYAKPVRELVMEGEANLDADGQLKVEIDTATALRDHGDQDHQYFIEAEVRDQSRRVISGQGAIKVTRQAYYAMIQPERGYYRPGDQININIRCLTPDNKPVKTDGLITVSEIVFGGPHNKQIKETQLDRFKASTDADGNLRIQYRHEKSGQLKFHFTAPDQWGEQVSGYGLVWVCGQDFDGKLHRFNDLEIITDKREYQPGEVAHVMINTQRPGSYVLYSDDVDNSHLMTWKLLHLPQKTTIIDIPVKKKHQPNFFVEATTVSNLRVHQQVARICVPPEKGVINVSVNYDKPSYKPGEEATVKVHATNLDGKPAKAQFTLSAFDKSVLYIAGENNTPMAGFFHGNLRHHGQQMATNLAEQFSSWGHVQNPSYSLYPYPPAWYGIWGPRVNDWREFDRDNVGHALSLEGNFSGEYRGLRRERVFKMAEAAQSPAPMAVAKSSAVAADAVSESEVFMGGAKLEQDERADGTDTDGEASLVEATVRQKFADTALWLTTLTTDPDGYATATFNMPENLTTWKLNAWAMTRSTRVGQANTAAVTTKNLLVRLQSPRFFTERDEVVLSANVHNYLATEKKVRVSLDIPTELVAFMDGVKQTTDITVPANGEKRVDWRIKVLAEGQAKITVKALTDEESDAMQLTLPVLVHGMTKQIATTGSMRPSDVDRTIDVEINVPNDRRPELSQLEVQFSPSLVGAMLDALPYCLDYPYGCTEQTMSRFMPAVLTLKTLQNMGITLEQVKEVRGRLAEVRRAEKDRRHYYYSYADSPVFDTEKMNDIVDKGLKRIASMQNGDGGWGWWKGNQSNGYLTSYVVYALISAQGADVKVDQNLINRGLNYLQNWEQQEMRKKYWSPHAQHTFAAYVLSMNKRKAVIKPAKDDKRPGDLIERLWTQRDKLNLYGKALLTMTLNNHDDKRAKTAMRNIMQYKEVNEQTQVAHFRTPRGGWWYWWNSDIETNAWILRAIVAVEPKSDIAPQLVKWLLNNRRNAYYWRSTRDTALCIAAMSDFVAATGEADPDYTLTLDYDNGAVTKTIKINRENFLTFDNRFVLQGVALKGGKHNLRITKTGRGALYFNTYLRYFTMEEPITAAGHEMHVHRKYFRLKRMPFEVEVEGADGQKIMEKRLRYERIELKYGDEVQSGELVQVELKVSADNDYTYLAFEDPKPAGMEPVDLQSGGKGQEGFHSYMELRDEKVVFFVDLLGQGDHLMRYRLRAEVPGVFHALPTRLFAMYAPELKANSHEQVIRIVDIND